jgi:hypothetical protein
MERPGTGERIVGAVAGGNLTWDGESIDKVIALGVASARVSRRRRRGGMPPPLLMKLASMTYRLKLAGDATQYDEAEQAVRSLASALNKRWNWRSPPGRVKAMSRTVLRYWLVDNCPACTGRKFQTLAGTPTLSTRVCRACGGSGKAPRPWDAAGLRGAVLRVREGEHHDALFAELQGVESEVEDVLRKLLRG